MGSNTIGALEMPHVLTFLNVDNCSSKVHMLNNCFFFSLLFNRSTF